MKDPVSTALEDLSKFAEVADSNVAMAAEVQKVRALYEGQTNAWMEAEAARRDAESMLATVCQLLNINPGELVP